MHIEQSIERIGQYLALIGVILPLLLIGGLKFTTPEIEALRPLISGTPWLAWLYPVFGVAGASYFLGVIEISDSLLLIASPWWPRVGIAGAILAACTFLVTSSLMVALPVWDDRLGGFPALNAGGQFLIKDIALLGIALLVAGDCLSRIRPHGAS